MAVSPQDRMATLPIPSHLATADKKQHDHIDTDSSHHQRGFDVLLRTFLEADPRPSLSLDLHARKHYSSTPTSTNDKNNGISIPVVSENPAFRGLDPSHRTYIKQWVGEVYSAAQQPADIALSLTDKDGQDWTCVILHNRWMVVSCNSALDPNIAAGSLPMKDSHKDPLASVSPSYNNSKENSKVLPTNEDTYAYTAAVLGWTRFSNPLTDHEKSIIRFPWYQTPLGPIETWPGNLKQAVSTMVKNPDPRTLCWGPECIMIYNEACAPIFGQKHPAALGARAADIWAEVWAGLGAIVYSAMDQGIASKHHNMPLMMERNGFPEESFFDLTMLPIAGSDERGNGALDQFTETTVAVINQRRQDMVLNINRECKTAQSLAEVLSLIHI